MPARKPLVLDFDGASGGIADALVLPMGDWQEAVRYGCGMATWRALRRVLAARMPAQHGSVLLGSGDFHHLSHLLIERLPADRLVDVVVCDNHPDNMRFPFGIHCGSWVRHAAVLPQVRRIHVVGITSSDIALRHAWENYLAPLYAGKLRYWSVGVNTRWAGLVGLAASFSNFASKGELLEACIAELRGNDTPVYFSIDKDVLATHVARTNWDQGCFVLGDLERLIKALAGRIVGSDISGDLSIHHYRTPWKRWLSALDDQPTISPADPTQWQAQQHEVNRQLLVWLNDASCVPTFR